MKYFCIYHVIKKSNVRKCYILTTLIVKRLEINRFWGIIMYLSNQSHTHTNRVFQKFSCQKMATKVRVLPILGKVIALLKKKTHAKKLTYFRYNLWKGTRFLDCQQNNCIFMQLVSKKSLNFTDFQRNKRIIMEPTRILKNQPWENSVFQNKSWKGTSYAEFCRKNFV